ncbi:unnamed protein product, partial [Callosobruchus maculatus]
VVVPTRDSETLLSTIQQWVHPGTEIHTDCWRGYNGLAQHGYIHKTVNHSDEEHGFVGLDGTHTQRIEATWRPAKDYFRRKRVPVEDFADHLVEYLWRRDCKKRGMDVMEALLEAVRRTYGDFRHSSN